MSKSRLNFGSVTDMASGHILSGYDICLGSENHPIAYANEEMIQKCSEFQYVCCNIPGHGTNTEPFEETIEGCDCVSESCDTPFDSTCSCIQRACASLESYTVLNECLTSLNPSVTLKTSSKRNISAIECNSSCKCSSKCGNRIVQHGIQYKLQVYEEPIKGLSLRTLDSIEKHSFVCEYAGEVLTANEAAKRFSLQKKTDMNYIFALKEHFSSGLQITYVDPRHFGNIGRFLNHSCDPNLFMTPVRVDNFVPKLCLFAKRDIDAGEELSYSYAGNDASDTMKILETTDNLVPCHCKSQTCSGYLPFDASALNT